MLTTQTGLVTQAANDVSIADRTSDDGCCIGLVSRDMLYDHRVQAYGAVRGLGSGVSVV